MNIYTVLNSIQKIFVFATDGKQMLGTIMFQKKKGKKREEYF